MAVPLRALLPVRHRPATLPDVVERAARAAERDPLCAYQKVCGFDVSDAVPATYLHVLAFEAAMRLMGRRDFPLPLLGLVHIANEMTLHRPVEVGEPLRFDVRAESLRAHRAGRQVDLITTAWHGTEAVWQDRSTYLHREHAPPQRRHEPSEPAAGALAVWRVPVDAGRRYAAVSGDRNPIHLSALAARAFGFPRAVAHGMWLHARALASVAPRLAAGYTAQVAFRAPVLLPSAVAVHTVRTAEGFHLELTGRAGKSHLVADITF